MTNNKKYRKVRCSRCHKLFDPRGINPHKRWCDLQPVPAPIVERVVRTGPINELVEIDHVIEVLTEARTIMEAYRRQ